MIVTLAGHVDHGKTTLVRQLTGVDTDRLAEEKRRGLTIDLGFAYLEQDGQTLGFVDVPGHHRFIHNMVAGVAAMQFALLVIAADDGPMPQSREHLQILELLGVQDGIVALTKCDRADSDRIGRARSEIAELVRGTFLEDAPVIETSAETGSGIAELRQRLVEAARAHAAAVSDRPFRMAIDRAFSLRGAGLVVTGTVHSGTVSENQEVFLFPGGRKARVRSLHAQNQAAAQGIAGDRVALNLAGLEGADIERGQWLSASAQEGHRCVVLEFEMLEDFPRPVRHLTPVHAYHATSHTTGRLALLDSLRLEPGQRGLVQLETDDPLLAKHGDRIVVRDYGLDRTLGGGRVVDNRPRSPRRRDPGRIATIAAYREPEPEPCLDALLALGPVNLDDFQGVWDLPAPRLESLVARQTAGRHGNELIADALWQRWRRMLLEECAERHRSDPALQGLQENEFAEPVPQRFRGEILRALVAEGRLGQQSGRFRPRQHQVVLAADEQRLFDRLKPLLDQPQPPSVGDISKTLRMPLPALNRGLKALASKRVVVQINDKRVYLPDQVRPFAEIAASLSANGPFSAREFRDAAGIGRNVAIDILEFFDARGYTRRSGDTRSVVSTAERLLPDRTG